MFFAIIAPRLRCHDADFRREPPPLITVYAGAMLFSTLADARLMPPFAFSPGFHALR